jgi:hypothetical protein
MCPEGSTNPQESCQQFDIVVKFNLAALVVPVMPVKLRFVTLFENYVSNFPVPFCFFDMLDAEERDSVPRHLMAHVLHSATLFLRPHFRHLFDPYLESCN